MRVLICYWDLFVLEIAQEAFLLDYVSSLEKIPLLKCLFCKHDDFIPYNPCKMCIFWRTLENNLEATKITQPVDSKT